MSTSNPSTNSIKPGLLLIFVCIFSSPTSAQETKNAWTGFSVRAGLGGVFDFETGLKKDKSPYAHLPASPIFRYGVEYGYQFDTGIFLAGALDWTIVYPRNFEFKGDSPNFFTPPISLWYVPITNVQLGYAFNDRWLATIGLIYYWGMSNSVRYRCSEMLFIETSSILWLDRIFKTGGFYGGGFDNFQLALSVGFLF